MRKCIGDDENILIYCVKETIATLNIKVLGREHRSSYNE